MAMNELGYDNDDASDPMSDAWMRETEKTFRRLVLPLHVDKLDDLIDPDWRSSNHYERDPEIGGFRLKAFLHDIRREAIERAEAQLDEYRGLQKEARQRKADRLAEITGKEREQAAIRAEAAKALQAAAMEQGFDAKIATLIGRFGSAMMMETGLRFDGDGEARVVTHVDGWSLAQTVAQFMETDEAVQELRTKMPGYRRDTMQQRRGISYTSACRGSIH